MLALPYFALISAGLCQAAAFASAYQDCKAFFESGQRTQNSFSIFFDITLIFNIRHSLFGRNKNVPNKGTLKVLLACRDSKGQIAAAEKTGGGVYGIGPKKKVQFCVQKVTQE